MGNMQEIKKKENRVVLNLPMSRWKVDSTTDAVLENKQRSSAITISYLVAALLWNANVEISADIMKFKQASNKSIRVP